MKSYCTKNEGNCSSCSLVNYGRDCQNNPCKTVTEDFEVDKKTYDKLRKIAKYHKCTVEEVLRVFMVETVRADEERIGVAERNKNIHESLMGL